MRIPDTGLRKERKLCRPLVLVLVIVIESLSVDHEQEHEHEHDYEGGAHANESR